MESSAKGILQVPNWAKLKRDKSNFVPWEKAVMEVLEAVGCEAAITEDFAKLQFEDEDYDSKSSSDDSDDFISKSRFPSPMPRQQTPTFRTFQPSSTASMQAMREQAMRRKIATKKMKKMKKKEKEFEEKKKKMDAKARAIIRHTIDAKAFEKSTYDCKTAHELWKTLQPTEAYTEEEIHRSLGRIIIHSNELRRVRMLWSWWRECMML